ncbi:MAG: hypothetical protein NT027_14005 [Proteobacteria bacterium]|nr:hypothetical protein [Pseudomonadota bacterium]
MTQNTIEGILKPLMHDIPKNLPFSFIVEELQSASPAIGRLFGSFSIYIGQKIVLVLRQKTPADDDNGVWIATTAEHHESLRKELPSMRDIAIFGPGPTGWQILPEESDSFENDVNHACRLILKGDLRIGKIPKPKKKSSPISKKTSAKLKVKETKKPAKKITKAATKSR